MEDKHKAIMGDIGNKGECKGTPLMASSASTDAYSAQEEIKCLVVHKTITAGAFQYCVRRLTKSLHQLLYCNVVKRSI
ncbi:hypothetical protein E2C01_026027 [Portunus trituberculatus]|uniref:Uncharacterized protein n=1 Tax=Portunus trituberculatus TaxID=210409 RepID=A0A5B7EF00_PORTR|nr:hypothetical protein [Portunus trituberculatus]